MSLLSAAEVAIRAGYKGTSAIRRARINGFLQGIHVGGGRYSYTIEEVDRWITEGRKVWTPKEVVAK